MKPEFGFDLFLVFFFRHAVKIRSVAAFLDQANYSRRREKDYEQQNQYFCNKFHVAKVRVDRTNQKPIQKFIQKLTRKKPGTFAIFPAFWF